jgi:pimeloyl-ACP methyl ester carboxylesterase
MSDRPRKSGAISVSERADGPYFVGTADNLIPPAEQRFMARRANAKTVAVRASHLPMVSRPGAVTRLTRRAAEAVA